MNLEIIKHENQLVVDSRQVAEMVDKEHAHLMRDIKGYEAVLSENPNLDSQDFFVESTYTNSQNKQEYPEYLKGLLRTTTQIAYPLKLTGI